MYFCRAKQREAMRHLIGIFSVLWALLLGGVSDGVRPDPHSDEHSAIAQPLSERFTADDLPNRDLLLSSAQSLLTAGEEEGSAPNVRPVPSNNRPHNLSPTGNHILRRPYRTVGDKGKSGTFAADRYLFALRRIRI